MRLAVPFMVCAALFMASCGGSETPETKSGGDQGDDEGVVLGDRPTDRRSVGPGGTDDADDDGFEVEGLKGHIPQYDINKSVQKNAGAIDACYRGKLAGRPYVGGTVELAFVVQKDGTVKTVNLAKSDLGDWSMEKCLLEVAAAMTFVKPKGGKLAEFAVPVEFEPRKRPMWWAQARIEVELEGKLEALGECAETEPPPADLLITAYVIKRGAIPSVGFAAPQGGLSEEWVECATEVMKGWALSDPRGRIAKLSFRLDG